MGTLRIALVPNLRKGSTVSGFGQLVSDVDIDRV